MADFSLIKFFQQFPTEEKSAEYFEKLRWDEVVVCPYCGKAIIQIYEHIWFLFLENFVFVYMNTQFGYFVKF